jgi:hypothetical protein
MTKDETGYNGWANYETWNIALWIGNDEGLYSLAKDCGGDYGMFRDVMRDELDSTETPDGIAWNDSGLNISELDDMMAEL